jgi:hypothetical protein
MASSARSSEARATASGAPRSAVDAVPGNRRWRGRGPPLLVVDPRRRDTMEGPPGRWGRRRGLPAAGAPDGSRRGPDLPSGGSRGARSSLATGTAMAGPGGVGRRVPDERRQRAATRRRPPGARRSAAPKTPCTGSPPDGTASGGRHLARPPRGQRTAIVSPPMLEGPAQREALRVWCPGRDLKGNPRCSHCHDPSHRSRGQALPHRVAHAIPTEGACLANRCGTNSAQGRRSCATSAGDGSRLRDGTAERAPAALLPARRIKPRSRGRPTVAQRAATSGLWAGYRPWPAVLSGLRRMRCRDRAPATGGHSGESPPGRDNAHSLGRWAALRGEHAPSGQSSQGGPGVPDGR